VTALPAPLLVITDRHQARLPVEAVVDAVGRGGGRWLLVRDRDLERGERERLAARLAQVARGHGMHVSVSADVELAAALGASIHLQSPAAVAPARRRLGAGAVIGMSAHGLAEVAAAAAAGADYVTLSPIFLTASKPGYGPALGLAAIGAAAGLGVPVLALGGVVAENVGACIAAGAAGVAVMGEIMRSASPAMAVGAYLAMHRAATGTQGVQARNSACGFDAAIPTGSCRQI
jgi:thiamine-phosphate pyrophosphorylase